MHEISQQTKKNYHKTHLEEIDKTANIKDKNTHVRQKIVGDGHNTLTGASAFCCCPAIQCQVWLWNLYTKLEWLFFPQMKKRSEKKIEKRLKTRRE